MNAQTKRRAKSAPEAGPVRLTKLVKAIVCRHFLLLPPTVVLGAEFGGELSILLWEELFMVVALLPVGGETGTKAALSGIESSHVPSGLEITGNKGPLRRPPIKTIYKSTAKTAPLTGAKYTLNLLLDSSAMLTIGSP